MILSHDPETSGCAAARRFRACFAALGTALLLTGCGAPVVASYMHPPPAPRGVEPSAHLEAARAAWQTLVNPARRQAWPEARQAYNIAVAAAFDDLRRADEDWHAAARKTGTRIAPSDPDQLNPGSLYVFPASKINTDRLGVRNTNTGVGLPVVGWIAEDNPLYESIRFPPPTGAASTGTALLRFDRGDRPEWEFRRPFASESVRLGGVEHPLEVDWSASHALYWEMSRLDKTNLANLFTPERFLEIEGVFFGQRLDRDRIPILFVHGLKSTPDVFDLMLNELNREEWFRDNYQVWLYTYPTGMPWPIAAQNFREHYAAAMEHAKAKGLRHLDRTVIVGHSMGGLITQASLRVPGTKVYSAYITTPIDQLELNQSERQLIEEMLMWEPLPHVRRAIFLAAPHRGSPMAKHTLAELATMFIKLPKTLTIELGDALVRNSQAVSDSEVVTPEDRLREKAPNIRIPTGIKSLQPTRPMFGVLPKLPFRAGVHLHSVIGNQGKEMPLEESSDGVVPYWSAHLPEAESERIVPSDHGVPRHPEAIDEVKRILKRHLQTH